jgi:hypothetical protein
VARSQAQVFGATAGVLVALTWVIWSRVRPSECSGGVTAEFHPPLVEAGNYAFRITLDDDRSCEFKLSLPLDSSAKTLNRTQCKMAIELRTRDLRGRFALTGFTFAAAPEHFQLRASRNAEVLYDTKVKPKYAPYETTRAESKHFCGERAFVEPPCVRGSSACPPYPVSCDGPEDCPEKKTCCAAPEWGRDWGANAAAECASSQNCLDNLGHIACHADGDCPASMTCSDASMKDHFKPPLTMCKPR